jgi:hypothetical protein
VNFEGDNGSVEFDADSLVIIRKGFGAKLGGLSGPPQRIPLAAISEVAFKDAGRMAAGWLQLGIGGSRLTTLSMGTAGADPNTVTFRYKHRAAFAELRDRLLEVIEANRQSGIDPAQVPVEMGGRDAKKSQKLTAKLGGDDAREDIVEAAARMGWRFGGNRELKALAGQLLEDETVRMIAQGSYESNEGIVVLTDRRVLFLHHGITSQRKEDLPLRSITSVQTKIGLSTGEIRLFASGNEATIKNIVKADAAPFAEAIRNEIAAGSASPSTSPAPDPADQLRKLAELRDAGVVSDAEFEAKKQELLARM